MADGCFKPLGSDLIFCEEHREELVAKAEQCNALQRALLDGMRAIVRFTEEQATWEDEPEHFTRLRAVLAAYLAAGGKLD